MRDILNRKKGVALFLVLATFAVVVALVIAILNIMLSHSRITQHQVGRIQAYYASIGGVNYAFEMLRLGTWAYDASTNPVTNTCPEGSPYPCQITDSEFPNIIQNQVVNVVFCPRGSSCLTVSSTPCSTPSDRFPFCIYSSVNYITREAVSPPK